MSTDAAVKDPEKNIEKPAGNVYHSLSPIFCHSDPQKSLDRFRSIRVSISIFGPKYCLRYTVKMPRIEFKKGE